MTIVKLVDYVNIIGFALDVAQIRWRVHAAPLIFNFSPVPISLSFSTHFTIMSVQDAYNKVFSNFQKVRDYLAPVLKNSKFKETGCITPEEVNTKKMFLFSNNHS